jgi:hypothetical protein
MSNSKKEQKNNPILTYCLLFLASIIIGTVSPHGILRALFTLFFMFIATFGIQTAVVSIKPFLTSAASYGKKHLRKSKLIDKKIINADVMGGSIMSTFMIMGGLLQLFIINYFIQRYTGIRLLDGYIIIFWMMLQMGIRLVNYALRFKNGEKIGDILLVSNVFDESDNKGKPKINIIISAIVVLTLIFIIKNNSAIIGLPEMYLEKGEDVILRIFFPGTKLQKYKTVV